MLSCSRCNDGLLQVRGGVQFCACGRGRERKLRAEHEVPMLARMPSCARCEDGLRPVSAGMQFCICPRGREQKRTHFALIASLPDVEEWRDRDGNLMPAPGRVGTKHWYQANVQIVPDVEDLGLSV